LAPTGLSAEEFPLAVGAALTSKMKKKGYVVLCFFGDGATNEGSFHESLNLASIWKLPVVFFCENNQYGMSGSVKEMVNIENLADRAVAYGIPGKVVDGNNILEVMEVTHEAVEHARSGKGPVLIEAKTYRWKGHSKSDARKYRTREEEQEWRKKDPIKRFKEYLIDKGLLTEEKAEQLREEAFQEIEDAVKYAESSPEPAIESLLEDVYA